MSVVEIEEKSCGGTIRRFVLQRKGGEPSEIFIARIWIPGVTEGLALDGDELGISGKNFISSVKYDSTEL